MASELESSIKFHDLSANDKSAAEECGEILSQREAWKPVVVRENPLESCEAWNHAQGGDLRALCYRFVESFPPLKGESSNEVRLNAVRFKHPVNVPMTPGVSVDLVPVFISSTNTPTIANTRLEIGQYVSLTHTARVDHMGDGYCICLLVLSS